MCEIVDSAITICGQRAFAVVRGNISGRDKLICEHCWKLWNNHFTFVRLLPEVVTA